MKPNEKNQADTQTNAACEAEKFPNPVDDIVPGWSIDPVTSERFFKSPKGTTFFAGSGGLRAAIGDKAPAPVCGWIEVVSEGCNRDGKGFKRLVRFKDRRGVTHRLMLDLSDIGGNPGAVCKRLLDDGLPLYSVTQQGGNAQLVDFLLNAPVMEQFTAADSYGWFERGGVFVLPAGAVGIPSDGVKVEPPGDDTGAPMYSQAGTLEEWKATIGMDARHSSRIAFAICIAFAAPLLAFTDEGSGGFHFVGKSSQGKSTAMKALCSVWAQAVEGCGELASWRSTDNGLEAVAAAHTDLPLILDELKQAERSVEQALYMLANGAGKRRQTRGLKAQKPLTWRTLYASTGELTADELAAQYGKEVATGANVRMANIPAVPEGGAFGVFETVPQGMTPEALAESFAHNAARIYGTAGPAFLARLVERVQSLGGAERMSEELRRMMKEWIESSGADVLSSQTRRVAKRFALVAAAGELAAAFGVLPWNQGEASQYAAACFRSFLADFETSEDRAGRLCEIPFQLIDSYPENFSYHMPDGGRIEAKYTTPFYGDVVSDMPVDGGEGRGAPALVLMTGEGWKKACGRNAAEIGRAMMTMGYLLSNNGRKFQHNGSADTFLGIPIHGRYIFIREGSYSAKVADFLAETYFSKGAVCEMRKKAMRRIVRSTVAQPCNLINRSKNGTLPRKACATGLQTDKPDKPKK